MVTLARAYHKPFHDQAGLAPRTLRPRAKRRIFSCCLAIDSEPSRRADYLFSAWSWVAYTSLWPGLKVMLAIGLPLAGVVATLRAGSSCLEYQGEFLDRKGWGRWRQVVVADARPRGQMTTGGVRACCGQEGGYLPSPRYVQGKYAYQV
jgi:hypothetical protein